MTDDLFEQKSPTRYAETCPLCAGGISSDFVAEITNAAAELSEPVSADQFLDMLAHGQGSIGSG